MAKEFKVAAYEGGNLHILPSESDSREVVLALSLNRLIVKMIRVPTEADPVEFAAPILQAMSPFPDEALTVGCEFVREDEAGKVMIAAAMPETSSDDIAEALDAAKVNVVRIDALVLGELRQLWNEVAVTGDGRKLLLVREADCISVLALDADQPSSIRAIVDAGDLRREVMLCLLDAEDFGGVRKLDEIVWVGEDPDGLADSLSSFAPVRKIGAHDVDAALRGAAERSAEAGSLNVVPASWQEVLEDERFKARLLRQLAVAGGIWLLVMGVLFATPALYDYLTGRQKDLCKQHEKQYKAVKDMKAKVDLVRKYSDHARGALEIMKAVSDRLPAEGVDLTSWEFRRDEALSVQGESDDTTPVYEFKDKVAAMGAEEGGEPVFAVVNLGPLSGKGNRKKFRLDCQYKVEEE